MTRCSSCDCMGLRQEFIGFILFAASMVSLLLAACLGLAPLLRLIPTAKLVHPASWLLLCLSVISRN